MLASSSKLAKLPLHDHNGQRCLGNPSNLTRAQEYIVESHKQGSRTKATK